MKVQALHEHSLVLSCLRSQSLPAFAGYLTAIADDRNRINTISRKALRRGVTHILRSTLQKSLTNLTVNSSPDHPSWSLFISPFPPKKPLHTVVIVLERANTLFNYPILNSRSLKTVSSIDVYLNLDDFVLHYSPMCFFSEFCAYCSIILHFILCN